MPAPVAIVILNWNGWRDTLACLDSLAGLRYGDWSIVVVDNGSTDDSVQRIRSAWPALTLLEAGRNLGFCGGNNIGIRHALARGASFIWLLNNDTKIDDPDVLARMVKVGEADPRIGCVGCVLVRMDAPTIVQAWGGGVVSLWSGRGREIRRRAPARKLDYLTGASVLIPRAALLEVGLLDEGFFLYWDDADFGFRLRDAGWKLAIADDCRIRHRSFATTHGALLAARFNVSAVRMYCKHAPLPWVPTLVATTSRVAKRAVLGRWREIPAILSSVATSWRGHAALRLERRRQRLARRRLRR